jgi:ferredoxin
MPDTKMKLISGVEPAGQPISFTFEQETFLAYPGESIASALMRAGILALRQTRLGKQPRGYFCGMGTCWECAVHVDAEGIVRSCSFPVSAGLEVSRTNGSTDE